MITTARPARGERCDWAIEKIVKIGAIDTRCRHGNGAGRYARAANGIVDITCVAR
jgi:hypothetical protein